MERIFSGIQPSGEIHLGNYLGAIKNWVLLLDKYECIFCIVDLHAMTVPYEPDALRERIFDAAVTNIACGLDPSRCTLFVQSHVPAHTELTWIFNCVTPIGELERMTQFKDKSRQHRHHINMGLLNYPVLMAADILLYRATAVPVGDDQIQHIELTREISRKFNHAFGELFEEPRELLTVAARIMGTDGKTKMSKSLNNTIGLLEPPDQVWEKLRTAVTDERRIRRSDPGDPDVCNLYTIHKGFSSGPDLEWAADGCRSASIGCIEHKKVIFDLMEKEIAPIRERAGRLRENPDEVRDILARGAAHCREIAGATMDEVRRLTGLR
jgi:tryptophanyl-tRNA synthetase